MSTHSFINFANFQTNNHNLDSVKINKLFGNNNYILVDFQLSDNQIFLLISL